MAGLCEGGNEPSGSLKAIYYTTVTRVGDVAAHQRRCVKLNSELWKAEERRHATDTSFQFCKIQLTRFISWYHDLHMLGDMNARVVCNLPVVCPGPAGPPGAVDPHRAAHPVRGPDAQCLPLRPADVDFELETEKRFAAAIEEKLPGGLHQELLQHDSARPHSANMTKAAIQELGWEVIPHPAYSPNLAPSDFHLFRSPSNSLQDGWMDEWTNDRWMDGRMMDGWMDGRIGWMDGWMVRDIRTGKPQNMTPSWNAEGMKFPKEMQ
ncbi:hypothetical protein ANN_21599 [Periplaneta americana]|uniref:Histone-lysine N-methyltransferase SETMAR n=1 Tax=Periplaneta americana TaxID=6978 RepID=A0ABQ8S689_PERAM|nr:hypothetical protein ANN_21599 [Periplaneta americana]